MKRLIALILAMLMLLTLGACGGNQNSNDTTETAKPTPIPTPEPEWEPGVVRAGYLGGLLQLFQRGDEVSVLGEWEGFYIIQGKDMPLLVEMQFLRPEGEEAPAEEQAYARGNTEMYTTGYLRGEAIAVLKLNTKVTVLDKKGDWALIRLGDGTEGYVNVENLSKWRITGGSSSGGSSSGPQDGTDVNLGNISYTAAEHHAQLLGSVQDTAYEVYEQAVPGVILSADTEAYAYLFLRDDEVKVTGITEATETAEAFCTVWVDGLYVTVPRWAIWMEGDAVYEPWNAYGRWGGAAYSEIQEWHELTTIGLNQQIEVLDELSEIEMYVIQVNGTYGYVDMGKLAKTRFVASSGGNAAVGSGETSNWTPPVM